jgi:hypothetical protein
VQLLREVVGFADLADRLLLGLEPVDVVFLADEDPLEQCTCGVVTGGDAGRDAGVEALDRVVLQLGTVSPTRTGLRRCMLGTPSKNRIRSMISSACFISSIDSCRECSASRSYPQLLHILAWMKYWLIAVNSAVSTSLSIEMIAGSPCMGSP